MKLKQYLLVLMLTGSLPVSIYGQNWSEKDSVWLSGILSGKDTVRINPEFQKAIREGAFLRLEDEPGQQILDAPAELPLLKDFSEYFRADTDSVYKEPDYKSISPRVYTVTPSALIDKKEIQVGKLPVAVAAGGRNLYSSDVVKDGQKRGTVGGSVKFYFSLNDMLEWVFSKKERNKRRNRKRDNTWRYYNSMP